MRSCTVCGRNPEQVKFHRHVGSSDGLQSRCSECQVVYNRGRTRPNPGKDREYQRAHHLRTAFGITIEQYDAMLAAQGGVCAICRQPETMIMKGRLARLAVDHCHDTNQVRGLLCRDCNTGIGKLRDDPDLLRLAISYLEASCPA